MIQEVVEEVAPRKTMKIFRDFGIFRFWDFKSNNHEISKSAISTNAKAGYFKPGFSL
jgi:hypothetical protein